MTLDAQFLDAMTEVVLVQKLLSSSSGGYGGRSYATSSAGTTGGYFHVVARLEQQLRVVMGKEGRDVTSNLALYCPPYDNSTGQVAVTLDATDLITLPTGYQTSPLADVERHNGETGLDYFALYL